MPTAADNGRPISRREFGSSVGAAARAAFGFQLLPSGARGGLERPALAGIGMGGKGRSDIQNSADVGFEIAALVDIVDPAKLKQVKGRLKSMADSRAAFPQARLFADYREMFAEMGDRIDAVTVSTPDHHHFHASAMAMLSGKHVYCQKPLTHGIGEARTLTHLAQKTGVKTQMGNQAHAQDHMRRCVELIRAGVIGPVREVHAWTNRPIWAQGFSDLPPAEKIPAGIHWDQWIGPAPEVHYSSKIAPFAWRGWWDYGTGALGDMACHIMDLGYWALTPGSPTSVIAEQEGATRFSPPINSKVTWEFARSRYTSAEGFRYFWYDGYVNATFDPTEWRLVKDGDDYNHPDAELLETVDFRKYGSVIVGERGKLFFNRGRNNWILKATAGIDGFQWPEPSLPRADGQNNHKEWLDAIEGKIPRSESDFSLAGPLTETILLGVLAQRHAGMRLPWDGEKMEVPGRPELSRFIQREYRDGWASPA